MEKQQEQSQNLKGDEDQVVKIEAQDPEDAEEQTLREDKNDIGTKLKQLKKRSGKLRKRLGCNARRAAKLHLASAGGAAPAEEGSL